jgi:hypothetical protein
VEAWRGRGWLLLLLCQKLVVVVLEVGREVLQEGLLLVVEVRVVGSLIVHNVGHVADDAVAILQVEVRG